MFQTRESAHGSCQIGNVVICPYLHWNMHTVPQTEDGTGQFLPLKCACELYPSCFGDLIIIMSRVPFGMFVHGGQALRMENIMVLSRWTMTAGYTELQLGDKADGNVNAVCVFVSTFTRVPTMDFSPPVTFPPNP